VMLGMLGVIMAVIIVTGIAHALHPPSNIEIVDPLTLHLQGEFAESSLGAATESRTAPSPSARSRSNTVSFRPA